MPLTLTQIVPPTVEPVSVPDLKAHLRIDHADEDSLLSALITAARDDIETYLRRQLLPATWTLALDRWQGQIRLPRPPTLAVVSVQYYDPSGVLQTLDPTGYQVDLVSHPARVCLAYGVSVPAVQPGRLNAILITYQAGYPSAWHVPPAIRHAVKMVAGDLYENREGQIQVGGGVTKVEENMTLTRMLYKHRLLEV